MQNLLKGFGYAKKNVYLMHKTVFLCIAGDGINLREIAIKRISLKLKFMFLVFHRRKLCDFQLKFVSKSIEMCVLLRFIFMSSIAKRYLSSSNDDLLQLTLT